MAPENLDRVDMAILYLLQTDARNITTEEIGRRVGLSSSAVATRIKALEEEGIVIGYAPVLNYEAAGFENHVLARANSPEEDTDSLVERIIELPNVVSVREVIGDRCNLIIEVVSETQREIEAVVDELNELDVAVVDTEMLKRERNRVFDTFGKEYLIDED